MVQEKGMKLIIITGPTSSGKSALAIELALIINGAVISADSMQIYKGMDIGTAKVNANEMRGVKHYLIDIVNPDEEFTVSDYRKFAGKAEREIINSGKIPIICGGTGLYLDSLIYNMSYGNADKNTALRESLSREFSEKGAEYVHNKLQELDPESALILHPNNKRRVIRAIEIAMSGTPKSEYKDLTDTRDYLMIGLNLHREQLYERINLRVEKMFREGLIDEVGALKDKYSWDLQSMQAIGYKEFRGYFDDGASLEDIKELIKKNTRNYAKRQLTWLKKYDINWFNPLNADEAIEFVKGNI
jgi:tRNA dimethylallyltransferase